jgi:hypothetical protein
MERYIRFLSGRSRPPLVANSLPAHFVSKSKKEDCVAQT